jgi:hypothetical protein
VRSAKNSALKRYAPKNGRNRDGNEAARKLGYTNRSVRFDGYTIKGKNSVTAVIARRTEPLFAFHEDGDERVAVACDVWEFRRFFDQRNGSLKAAREWMAGVSA